MNPHNTSESGAPFAFNGPDASRSDAAQQQDGRATRFGPLHTAATLLALALVYPVGLYLLWKRPSRRRWRKVAATLLFLPLFPVQVVLPFKPYWDFGGGMTPGDFRLDFDRGRTREDQLAQHREQMRARPAATTPTLLDSEARWTDFRGANRDGVVPAADARISTDWKAHPPRELWRQPVGGGYASFVVADGRCWTMEQRGGDEAVTCYDVSTGREVWAFEYPALFTETMGGDGPRATPTWRDGRIYAYGATGWLHCLDAADGRKVWSVDVLGASKSDNLYWAMSGAPLIVDDAVLVSGSGVGGPSVFAYDAATGQPRWTSDVGQEAYSSLMLVELCGRRTVLNLAGANLNGIDPGDGSRLWSYPFHTMNNINCSQPVLVGGDRVFVSAGYGHGAALVQVRLDGAQWQADEVWSNTRMRNKFTSSVLHGDHLYGLDERNLVCIEAATGKRAWKGGAYDYGSVLLAGDQLLVLGEQGELALVRATPSKFEELARVQVFTERTWNNFVVVRGILLARNHKEMACYDLRP